MKKWWMFLFFLLIPFVVHGEDWELKWEHNYGGSGYEWFNNLNYSYDKDGNIDGYIVTGETSSEDIPGIGALNDNYSGLLVKYDLNGNVVWEKGTQDYPSSETNTFAYRYDKNGNVIGYIITVSYGSQNMNGCYEGVLLVYDLNGNLVITKQFNDRLNSRWPGITPIYDNNDKITGYYYSSYYFRYEYDGLGMYNSYTLKLDMNFNVVSQMNEYINDRTKSIYFIESYNNGKMDGYIDEYVTYDSTTRKYGRTIVKYDRNLNVKWEYQLSPMFPLYYFTMFKCDKNGNGYVFFDQFSNTVFKLDVNGEKVWEVELSTHNALFLEDILLTYNTKGEPDGYLFGGEYDDDNVNAHRNMVLVKVSLDGRLLWEKHYGGSDGYEGIYPRTGNGKNLLMSMDKNGKYDGYYVLLTESRSSDIPGITQDNNGNAIFLKYDFNGNIVWQYAYGGNEDSEHEGWDVGDNLIYSYDLNGNIDGVIFMMSDTSSNFGTIVNKGDYDPVLVKFGFHKPKMDISVTLDDKDIVLYEKERESTYKVLVKNIGNTDSDDNIIKTVIPQELEIIEDSISDSGTYDKDSRTITWTYGKLMMGDSKEFSFKVKTKDKLDKNIQFNSTLTSSITSNQESNEVKIIINPITKVGIGLLVIVLFIGSVIYLVFIKNKKLL